MLWCFLMLQLYTSKKSKCTLTDGPGTWKFVKWWREKLKKHRTPFHYKWKVTKLKISQTGFKANILVNLTQICFYFWNFNNKANNIFAIWDKKLDKNIWKYFTEKETLQKLGKNWGFVQLSHRRWIKTALTVMVHSFRVACVMKIQRTRSEQDSHSYNHNWASGRKRIWKKPASSAHSAYCEKSKFKSSVLSE